MLLAHGLVVVVLDSHDWRLLRNAGNEAVPVLAPVETPALAEAHHASGTSGQRHADADHAAAVAAWMNRQVAEHKVEHFALIAPPRVLGEVRPHLTPAVERALVKELGKDLIGRHESEILETLRESED
ncbi:AtsE [Novosphingobium nitrogenifigens DSM 19370]|uniref:AtsE n=1 Tax=Novosphingobium nitrogenifigens DSM 19370 TaxID=983920 RepID=F1Z9S3_9SPHN|nr:host attachment protein [Novosphingobium nitrogenifigens]EGD58669.1 AtsE [Novosphingobium nitrogenifigens DSM 19370]